MKEKTREYLANLFAGALIAAAVFALDRGRGHAVVRCLCDGSFVAAVMLLGLGVIKAIRNRGAFDVTGFGVKTALETALPLLRREEKETLEAYRERKASERKPARPLLLAGATYLAVSLITLAIYYMA